VLEQVDKFIYSMDFNVLNTQPVEAYNSIPIILGHPFLARWSYPLETLMQPYYSIVLLIFT